MATARDGKRLFEDLEFRTVSVRDVVYAALQRAITEGELEPGRILKEVELSRDLGVSRTPVREALYQLAGEGFLVRLPSGRVEVARISPEEAGRLVDVREALEALVARQLAGAVHSGELSGVELDRVDALLHEMEAAAGGPSQDLIRLGYKFHLTLAELTRNKTLLRFLEQVVGSLGRYRYILWDHPARRSDNVTTHRVILERIRAGDVEGAEEVVRRHIRSAREAYIELIASQDRVREAPGVDDV